MDEQRLAAYLELIQALLECPNGANDILEAHRELVDADFVQVMEALAENMTAEGNSNAAWLQSLATYLANYVSNTATPEEYVSFLMEVLQATDKSRGNPQVVYPILKQNLDKLDLNFAQMLQACDTSTFTELASAASIAAAIGEFGNLINQFPLGRRTWNLEIGIGCYTAVLQFRTRKDYPEDWAWIQNNLGEAYRNRIAGVRAENIEEAIARCTAALEVCTRKDYPEDWAMTQNNLGNAYRDRIEGVRAANIELAIACFREALIVYTPENYPEKWAMTQNNLGNAYRDRIEGVRAANIELAIACFREALIVYTPENYPEKWATTQNNLGAAYSNRIEGVRAANIELAIACYREALIVRTRENYPEEWADTQNNLGAAYSNRIEGVRAANIELAIACFREALKVYTPDNYPEKWAGTQNNLGAAYSDRIEGLRAANIELAIACYREALKVYKRENYPEQWATTQNNLGIAYRDRIEGVMAANIEEAISCYREALIVLTPTAFPFNCLTTGRNLGNTAFTAGFWDIALEGFDTAIQAVEKSRSWATSDHIRQQMIAESKGSQQATVATYRNLAQNVNVIHSSHHAVSRLDKPLESRLFLGDGSITLGELMTPGWRLPQLSDVFMSCCETNLASTEITDNLLSLGTGFLCAGARSVVSTLWAVDDFATSLFSIFYYQYRREGLSRPEALRRAQVRLRTISGAELKKLYQPQIDPLLPKIIGDLKRKLNLVQEELEDLESQQKKYKGGTAEYKEFEEKLNKKTEEEVEIRKRKEGYENLQKNLYTMSNPFDDLIYWSGFICQGLH